jgi:phosphoserine aminotransferase
MTIHDQRLAPAQPDTAFLGLAPFLRMSIAGTDYLPMSQEILARAKRNSDDANLWMNLATIMQCLGQRDIGLAAQAQALAMKRSYHLPPLQQPAQLRVLLLLAPGDLTANTPLDCLLEDSDIHLDYYYVSSGDPFADPIPDHDVLMVGISEGDAVRDLLRALEQALEGWPKPVVNLPRQIPLTGRAAASKLLRGAPGLCMPASHTATRSVLLAIANNAAALPEAFVGCDFPIIVRPANSHCGTGLAKMESAADLAAYLAKIEGEVFSLSPFIDYSGPDGLFRKYRVALIDGAAYACHMAVSSNWMVHYVNAGMYEEPRKRAEEAAFMANFDDFAKRHRQALEAIGRRTKLDYLVIDCAETADGELLVFEIGNAMIVHDMDPPELFAYKRLPMRKVKTAFRDFLLRRHRRGAGARSALGFPRKPDNNLNFSGGPGALPESVLRQVQESIMAVPGVGLSVLGISHRSDWFAEVVTEVESNIRALLGLPEDYHVLLLQGGGTQQFSMIPMALLRGKPTAADYLHTGYWSGKAIPEAKREGQVRVVWSGEGCAFRRLPGDDELSFAPDAAYLHYVSNETVEGLQFHRVLGRDGVPRICDMSSDFLSKPCEAERFSLIYAHAQKNIGPAGVTVVLVRKDLLAKASDELPGFLNYHTQAKAHSIFNTPPVFAIYVVLLVTRWLIEEIGGLARMAELNRRKAELLYRVLDASDGFYRGRAKPRDRSVMNVSFDLATLEMEQRFLAEALDEGFSGLAGHRAIGGVRASIYNALPLPAVAKLAGFMEDFQRRQTR